MSMKEIDRMSVVQKVVDKHLKQKEGARLLELSKRQMIRLVKQYRREGAAGLTSKHKGQTSNYKYSAEFKNEVMNLVKLQYPDFGPTLAHEKLLERDNRSVNRETLRHWMINEGLWIPHRRRKAVLHQQRERRPCFGELVQIDGSPHDWFEGRADKCCLFVFIDDATSRLLHLRFEPRETTAGYFHCVDEYIKKNGKPVAFYSDKHSIFRVNLKETVRDGETQFSRAMASLNIEIICANSPQAKGRVEKANRTLQDRLVKELRLRGISNIDIANSFLPEFMSDYNNRFAVEAVNATDAHRPCKLSDEKRKDILCHHYTRTLSKNLELSYGNVIYQVKTIGEGYGLRHAKVGIYAHLDGQVTLHYKGRSLLYTTYQKQKRAAGIVSSKDVNKRMDELIKQDGRSIGHKPKINHPWRQYPETNATVKEQVR
jgi:transposase